MHARAYKLLARLASHVVGPAAQESATHALFMKCDTARRGGLTLPELARFLSALSYRAAESQAATQQDLHGQPTALPLQVRSAGRMTNRSRGST